MARCNICGKEKDALALNIVEHCGQLIIKCMECYVNEWADDDEFAIEAEIDFVATQKAFFKSADKIWKRLGA